MYTCTCVVNPTPDKSCIFSICSSDLIDRVLRDDDVDKNGYLSYTEYVRARRREEYHYKRMHEENVKMQQNAQWDQFQQFQQFQAMQVSY